MRHPERDPALDAETEFAEFAVVKAVVIGDEHEFGLFYRRAKIQARILRREPFMHFGIRKEEHVPDSLFVNRFEREVERRDDGIVTQRKSHHMEAILVKYRRLARVVAQVIDRHAGCHAFHRLDSTWVRTPAQVERAIQIKYDCLYRFVFHDAVNVANTRKKFYILRHEDSRQPFLLSAN